MMYWSYMLLTVLLIPAVMLIAGLILRRHAPRTPNGIWGYRTGRSLKNQETWDYGNRYIARIWFHWGLILLPLSVVPMLFFIGAGAGAIGIVVTAEILAQMFPLLFSIYLTEKALKKKFNEDGSPREETV